MKTSLFALLIVVSALFLTSCYVREGRYSRAYYAPGYNYTTVGYNPFGVTPLYLGYNPNRYYSGYGWQNGYWSGYRGVSGMGWYSRPGYRWYRR